jgi:hypothetical protein
MIGSETFIIVALRCTENSTPCSCASRISRARKAFSAAARMTAASTISPACTSSPSLSTVVEPSAPTCSMRSVVAGVERHRRLGVAEVASVIVATWLLVSGDQAPMEWGCFLA